MVAEITSHDIIAECVKEYGKNCRFARSDGFEFEETRSEKRQQFLDAHPQISDEHRELILKASVTPGMTREELIAAWGLLDEDTRIVFGHVTDDRRSAYAYFTGFRIGEPCAVYFKDDIVVGVRLTGELVPPHEEELTMRLAEERYGLYYFYEGNSDKLVGSDRDQHHIDWDSLHLHLYRIEPVPPISMASVEANLAVKGVRREYELSLIRQGYDSASAPLDVRKFAALSVMPYPYSNESAETKPAAPISVPIALPPSSFEAAALERESSELGKWLAYIHFGHKEEMAFPGPDGQVELLAVKWLSGQTFSVEQVPLVVNGISINDVVEGEWRDGNLIPVFARMYQRHGRTVRVTLTAADGEAALRRFAKLNVEDRRRFRYENGVLAFTIYEAEIDDISKEWLGYLPVNWIYTDTLTQY